MMPPLKSSRYAAIQFFDKYDRNSVFVELCCKYPTILETGCSTGFLSRIMVENKCHVIGIEIDEEAAEKAREYCARVFHADLNGPDWPKLVGETFDLITFGDVLEHLNDPVSVLRQARGLLKPRGHILVCLPNICHWSIRLELFRGQFDYQETGILDFTHIRFFSLKTARAMFKDAGYNELMFRPIVGGRFCWHFRKTWNRLAHLMPGILAYQMMFLIEPVSG